MPINVQVKYQAKIFNKFLFVSLNPELFSVRLLAFISHMNRHTKRTHMLSNNEDLFNKKIKVYVIKYVKRSVKYQKSKAHNTQKKRNMGARKISNNPHNTTRKKIHISEYACKIHIRTLTHLLKGWVILTWVCLSMRC